MAYPFGGIPLGVVRDVLRTYFSIEELTTDGPVHTPDGPRAETFWLNRKKNRFVETPSGEESDRVSSNRVAHIARRLQIDYNKLLERCSAEESRRESAL